MMVYTLVRGKGLWQYGRIDLHMYVCGVCVIELSVLCVCLLVELQYLSVCMVVV